MPSHNTGEIEVVQNAASIDLMSVWFRALHFDLIKEIGEAVKAVSVCPKINKRDRLKILLEAGDFCLRYDKSHGATAQKSGKRPLLVVGRDFNAEQKADEARLAAIQAQNETTS